MFFFPSVNTLLFFCWFFLFPTLHSPLRLHPSQTLCTAHFASEGSLYRTLQCEACLESWNSFWDVQMGEQLAHHKQHLLFLITCELMACHGCNKDECCCSTGTQNRDHKEGGGEVEVFWPFGSIDGDDSDEGSVGLTASHQLVERFQLETSRLPGVGERCHVNLERMN